VFGADDTRQVPSGLEGLRFEFAPGEPKRAVAPQLGKGRKEAAAKFLENQSLSAMVDDAVLKYQAEVGTQKFRTQLKGYLMALAEIDPPDHLREQLEDERALLDAYLSKVE